MRRGWSRGFCIPHSVVLILSASLLTKFCILLSHHQFSVIMDSMLVQSSHTEEIKSPMQVRSAERLARPWSQSQRSRASKYGNGPSSTSDEGWDLEQPRTSYSPTKPELESHPIRQRLSTQGDEVTTGLGTAPEYPPLEIDRWASPTVEELVHEVDRTVPHTMADTSIKEGDAGTFANNLGACGCDLSLVACLRARAHYWCFATRI